LPQVQVEEMRPGSAVVVVGNGPSLNDGPKWFQAVRWARRRHPDVRTALINRRACGRNVPDFAVAVGPEVLGDFQRKKLHEKTRVCTNAPHKVVGPSAEHGALAELFFSKNALFGRDDWPPHASGPLAIWMMAALGFHHIYLLGLDGTAHTPSSARAPELPTGVNPRVWETHIKRYLKSREEAFDPKSKTQPRLIRVWPNEQWSERRDPLAPVLRETVHLDKEGVRCKNAQQSTS
jgi:hypothetical protein